MASKAHGTGALRACLNPLLLVLQREKQFTLPACGPYSLNEIGVPVAQWLEHCVSSTKVVGSIPREHMY